MEEAERAEFEHKTLSVGLNTRKRSKKAVSADAGWATAWSNYEKNGDYESILRKCSYELTPVEDKKVKLNRESFIPVVEEVEPLLLRKKDAFKKH